MRRFWSKVDRRGPNECWPWKAGTNPAGYGMFRTGGVGSGTTTAHRIAYVLTHGEIDDEAVVCHHCDNPPCCNPAHLFSGTHADNVRDKMEKGRFRIVAKKLSDGQVAEIRERYAAGGVSHRALAAEYEVQPLWIGKILRREARVRPCPLITP